MLHEDGLDHTRHMVIGGSTYRLPAHVALREHTACGHTSPAWFDEQGQFWAWDSAHVRERLAERHIRLYYNTEALTAFHAWQLLAEGDCHWDYFVHPTLKSEGSSTVAYVAKVEGCKSGSFGNLVYFNQMYSLHPEWYPVLREGRKMHTPLEATLHHPDTADATDRAECWELDLDPDVGAGDV